MKIRPQILVAIIAIAVLGGMVVVLSPGNIEVIAGGAVTAIGMLGMKLLEGE